MIICVVAPRIWFRLSSKIGQSCQWANGDEDHHDEENRFHSKFKCPRAENNISRLWLRRLNRFAVGVGDSWHHASDSPSWLLISLLAQIRRPLVKWVKAIWLPFLPILLRFRGLSVLLFLKLRFAGLVGIPLFLPLKWILFYDDPFP